MSEDTPKPNNDPNPRRQNVEDEYIILEDNAASPKIPNNQSNVNSQFRGQQIPPMNAQFNQGAIPPGGFQAPPYNPNAFQRPTYKKSKFPRTVIIIIIAAIIFLLLFASGDSSSVSKKRYVVEEKISMNNSKNKIAIIDVNGMILEGGGTNLLGMAIPSSFELLTNGLRQAAIDDNVKALIIAINSPGGGMTASDILYKRIMDFKAETKNTKPVIAMIKDMAASGGYYIASACDYIIAYPTALTGSIGVIMQGYNFSGLMEKYGVEDATITSVPDKDRGSPTRKPNPYDKEFFQIMLRKMHKRFIDKVYAGRLSSLKTQNKTLNRSEVEKWADGNIVLADDAVQIKMIDGIGYEEDAWTDTMTLANLENANIVKYHMPRRKIGLLELMSMESKPAKTDAKSELSVTDLAEFVNNSSTRVWALWLGGSQELK